MRTPRVLLETFLCGHTVALSDAGAILGTVLNSEMHFLGTLPEQRGLVKLHRLGVWNWLQGGAVTCIVHLTFMLSVHA